MLELWRWKRESTADCDGPCGEVQRMDLGLDEKEDTIGRPESIAIPYALRHKWLGYPP